MWGKSPIRWTLYPRSHPYSVIEHSFSYILTASSHCFPIMLYSTSQNLILWVLKFVLWGQRCYPWSRYKSCRSDSQPGADLASVQEGCLWECEVLCRTQTDRQTNKQTPGTQPDAGMHSLLPRMDLGVTESWQWGGAFMVLKEHIETPQERKNLF